MKLSIVASALAAAALVSAAYAQDTPECEVCVKVMNDVNSVATEVAAKVGKKAHSKKVLFAAIEKVCEKNKKIGKKDKKLCYFVKTMKKEYAKHLSYKKPPLKVCKTMAKQNPEVCQIKYPKKTAGSDYKKMRVKQLRAILAERGAVCVGCYEKRDYVKRCEETEHLEL